MYGHPRVHLVVRLCSEPNMVHTVALIHPSTAGQTLELTLQSGSQV